MDIIRAAALPETRWRNDAGRKADIASGSGWLVALAWLESDAPFSDCTGHDRTIVLLDGRGFSLELPEGSLLTVDRRGEPAAFDGKGPIACHLLGGSCTVLNVITAYPGYSHTVQAIEAADLADLQAGPQVFVIVLSGNLAVGDVTLTPYDALRLSELTVLHASRDARLAVVRIEPIDDAEA